MATIGTETTGTAGTTSNATAAKTDNTPPATVIAHIGDPTTSAAVTTTSTATSASSPVGTDIEPTIDIAPRYSLT